MSPRVAIRSRVMWTVLGMLWLGGVVVGLGMLSGYDNRAGAAANAPAEWPAGSRIMRDTSGPTLVMLAHPRCDCTRASVAELAELMARASPRPKAYVVFISPPGVGDDWDKTDLWQIAARIPGVTVRRDEDGLDASHFGAFTSGQILLYGVDGRLLFSGGTTGSRGHVGENAGRATILALLNNQNPGRSAAPVFGCPLLGPEDGKPSEAVKHHGSESD